MAGPLVSRPPYGEDSAALPRGDIQTAESKLPGGGPPPRGFPIEDRLKGEKTYQKPETDIREDKPEDSSIYRNESPDKMLQDPDELGTREDNADASIGFNGLGPYEGPDKTKYPYRDGIPNRHSSVEFVAELWKTYHSIELPVSLDSDTKIAARIVDILSGINPKVMQRSSSCSVNLARADIGNLRWIFAVDCGNGTKLVKLKAYRKNNIVKLALMDLHMQCSCPAWRWLGSEHHALQDDYIDGSPRGTASVPVIKDPLMHNRVCKHVAAVMGLVKKWEIPAKKGTR